MCSRILKPSPLSFQSDEGPFPEHANAQEFDWRQATPQQLRQKMGILNALYFPEVDMRVLSKDLTPVNSFRIVMNVYFDQGLPLLPNRSYAFYSEMTCTPFSTSLRSSSDMYRSLGQWRNAPAGDLLSTNDA